MPPRAHPARQSAGAAEHDGQQVEHAGDENDHWPRWRAGFERGDKARVNGGDADARGHETVAGAAHRAALAVLNRDGRVDLDFKLQGRTDDPKFSLDESLSTRIAAGFAEAVGVSVKGVATGVGGVFRGLLGGSR